MRLFIAIPTTKKVNNQLEDELKDVQEKMKGQDIKYQPPEKWHFTLVFLGDQKESSVDKIKAGIEKSLNSIKPIDITFKKIKYPPGRDPRMIWTTTDEDSSRKLESIKGKIVENLKLEGVNWKRNKRSFKGHLTLARFNFNKVDTNINIKKEIDIKYQSPSIQLIKSELKQDGSKYTVLEEFNFKRQD